MKSCFGSCRHGCSRDGASECWRGFKLRCTPSGIKDCFRSCRARCSRSWKPQIDEDEEVLTEGTIHTTSGVTTYGTHKAEMEAIEDIKD